MTPVYATVAIEMELAGAGGGWTVITDVVSTVPIRASYGIHGNGPRDRVASSGTMTFALDNSDHNSAGVLGYYSPSNPAHRAGFGLGTGVRLKLTYGAGAGITYYKWRGVIDSITPIPGQYGDRRVAVTCVDWMDEAARAKPSGIAVQVDKFSDQVFSTLLAGVARQPPATYIVPGSEVYPFSLDNVQDESTSVLSELQRLAQSEFGYVYVKGDTAQGGTLSFEGRRKRAARGGVTFHFSDAVGLAASHQRDNLLNRVQVQVHPRRKDAAATSILFNLESKPKIQRVTSQTFNASYRDPAQKAQRVGGMDMVAPVATTDYLFNSAEAGNGTDLTSQLTVAAVFGGNSANVTVTNNGPQDGYLVKLQLRGRGLYDFEPTMAEVKDATSQSAFGENPSDLDMPHQASMAVASDVANFILNLNKDPATLVDSITIVASASDDLMIQALAREISDKIEISDVVLGLNHTPHFINGITLEITADGLLTCTWDVAIADATNYWLLEVNGFTELGLTTRLGYGIFVVGWILDTSMLGTDTFVN